MTYWSRQTEVQGATELQSTQLGRLAEQGRARKKRWHSPMNPWQRSPMLRALTVFAAPLWRKGRQLEILQQEWH